MYVVFKVRRRDSGSVGGVRPCQGRGRGFESRLSLKEEELRLLFLLSKIKINEAAGMIPFPDS